MKRAARYIVSLFVPRGKFAISLLIFLLVWPMFLPLIAVGQETPPPPSSVAPAPYTPEVPRDENTSMQIRLINVLSAIGCQLAGVNPAYPNRPCVGIDRITEKVSFIPKSNGQQIGGAIGFVTDMTDAMYAVPAASTHDYLSYLGDNFGIAKKVHAQGVGFSSLSPVLPLWTASRNIAYLFYILAFIVIGILIMIRVRIDPRTVMTIQNQIPKIVVGIILITFSYAIAGFLIDLMYTTMYVASNIVTSVQVPKPGGGNYDYSELSPSIISATNPLTAASRMSEGSLGIPVVGDTINGLAYLAEGPAREIGEALGGAFGGGFGLVVTRVAIGAIGALAGKSAGEAAGGGKWSWLGGGIGTLLTIGTIAFPELLPVKFVLPFILAAPTVSRGLHGGVNGTNNWSRAGGFATALAGLGLAVGGALLLDKVAGDDKSLQDTIFQTIAFVIIAVAIISSLIRLWFTLMKAYILILLNIILAPFYILFGLFPGSGWSFNTWLRTMCAHLAVFPVVVVVFLVARVIMDGIGATQSQGVFVPPFLGNASVAGTIQSIVGLTFILVMPAIVEMVRGIFQSKPSQYTGPAINPGVAAGVGYATGLVKNPISIMSQSEEARWDVDTGGYQKTGTLRSVLRKFG